MNLPILALSLLIWAGIGFSGGDEKREDRPWRTLPLIKRDKIDSNWVQIPWGRFVVDRDSLRSECDEKGMGLLLYKKEKFGDCQIRVVFKSKDARSNSGVFVRIDDGILKRLDEKTTPLRRNKDGSLSKDELKQLIDASDKDRGPWYAVHHGYEVQICDRGDGYHRTGAIYSLATATAAPTKKPMEWKTMVITLQGNLVLVDVDGKRITTFDPDSKDVPARKEWFEPRREPKRPRKGYIGLQTHDPGDVVYFKEISVRPLEKTR
jgi:hypothetical protein